MIHRALALLVLALGGAASPAEAAGLTVAISIDMPPYVMRHAAAGLEVDVLRGALPGNSLRFVQMPFDTIETAVRRGQADVAVPMRGHESTMFPSKEFVRFANVAISRKTDRLRIDDVADLKGHRIVTWQGAYLDLGGAFERQYAPGSPERASYVESHDLEDQVRDFWRHPGTVTVIDPAIFRYFSEVMGHPMSEVDVHAIFAPVTGFKAGFRDAAVRDAFDRGLAGLCRSGRYAALLARNDIGPQQSVCGR